MDFLPEGVAFNKNITYLAKTNFRRDAQVFGIRRRDRRQHMYVLGKSGSGKSALLGNMIVQNIWNGEGVCVVDPHGELVESILATIPAHRAKDVIYFNPADTDYHIGFNVLQIDDPKYKHLVASGLMGIFTKIWANAWSARMEYILNNAILALADTPGSTLLGIQRLLVDKDYRQVVISNLKDPVIKAFWVHEYETWRDQYRNEAIAPIQNKVGQFLSTSIVRNIVGQAKSTLDLFDLMNTGKIFLVNVSKGRIGEDNSALLGGMIITKLQLAAMERVRIPEDDRKDFYLYVDEFQNFVTDSFASILSEARKYRLNLTLAHQYVAQLVTKDSEAVRDAVFGNVGTMIIFRVGAADAEYLEPEFSPEFSIEDLVNLPNYTIYLKLMVDGVTSRPFSASTLPPFKIPVDSTVAAEIIETSRKLYARPKEAVEAEINNWSGMLVGLSQEGKFKATCSSCGKETMVPFEPEPGRPVYCKDCIAKIKSGEIKPAKGSRPSRSLEPQSFSALSGLGIEFIEDSGAKPARSAPQPPRSAPSVPRPMPPRPPQFAPSAHTSPVSSRPAPSAPVTPPVSSPIRPTPSTPIARERVQPTPPGAPSVAQAAENKPSEVRVRNMRPARERATPDHEGLQSILKSALGEALSKNMQTPKAPEQKTEIKNTTPEAPVETGEAAPTKKETISLSSLKKPETETEISSAPATVPAAPKLAAKNASLERMSALQAAIAKAKSSSAVSSQPVVAPVSIAPVESAVGLSVAVAAEAKKEEPVVPTQTPPTIPPTSESIPPSPPQEEPEPEKASEETKEKKIREVPEDILRGVLKE